MELVSEMHPAIDEKEYALLLLHAIERLPHKQQQTHKLIKEQGLKRQEVAGLLNVSPETVKWNLDQAVKSVRAFCISNLDLITFFIILDRIA